MLVTITPNSNYRKQPLLEWLQSRNILFSTDMLKTELYELVQLNIPYYEKYFLEKIKDSLPW